MMTDDKKEKIYIIENDANVLYGLQAKLSMEGFVVEISDGADEMEHVLNLIRISKPDYIVLNLILPKIDGVAFLKALKSEDGIKLPCIFAFTNLSEKDDQKWIGILGADSYFIKNEFAIDSFAEKLKKIIENRKKIGKN